MSRTMFPVRFIFTILSIVITSLSSNSSLFTPIDYNSTCCHHALATIAKLIFIGILSIPTKVRHVTHPSPDDVGIGRPPIRASAIAKNFSRKYGTDRLSNNPKSVSLRLLFSLVISWIYWRMRRVRIRCSGLWRNGVPIPPAAGIAQWN